MKLKKYKILASLSFDLYKGWLNIYIILTILQYAGKEAGNCRPLFFLSDLIKN